MFVIELIYKADLTEIDMHMAAHVRFLKKYYASGHFLVERHSNRTRTRASKSSSPAAPATSSLGMQCAQELDEILTRLDIISCTVAVAASALEGQNADVDRDVASTLRMCVRSSLADQVERLSAVIRKLQ